MVAVQKYRANQLPFMQNRTIHTKTKKLGGSGKQMLSGSSPKSRLSALGSCHCVQHTFTHLSFLFFILRTRRGASFAQLIPAISIVVFSLLHYANWIGSIPAQIISSCQKDYHIIKGETLLNFNQPGLITMYMQMLNFTSFFLHPVAPDHFRPDETLLSLISGSDCLLSKVVYI